MIELIKEFMIFENKFYVSGDTISIASQSQSNEYFIFTRHSNSSNSTWIVVHINPIWPSFHDFNNIMELDAFLNEYFG